MRLFDDKFYMSPDVEGAGGDVDETVEALETTEDVGGDDGGTELVEGEEPAKPLSVREEIIKAAREASADADKKSPKKPAPKSSKPSDTGAKPATATPAPDGSAQPTDASPPPESLSKEAKAAWAQTPPVMQQAFLKREQDMAQGVSDLKKRYEQIDSAIAPHNDALRQMNATPAEAVNRMFLWFKALAGKPADSFPALAQSMGLKWEDVVKATTGGTAAPVAASGEAAPAGTAPAVPDEIRTYVSGLEAKVSELANIVQQVTGSVGTFQQNLNADNERKTRENLSVWSGGKEFFEEVRQDMAALIQSGMIPLKADGTVDLDTAYERAIYYNPAVRAKVLAKQQQADTTVQEQTTQAATTARQAQVQKARKAAVSLPTTNAPGTNNGGVRTQQRKPGQKRSVRESLLDAIQEARD